MKFFRPKTRFGLLGLFSGVICSLALWGSVSGGLVKNFKGYFPRSVFGADRPSSSTSDIGLTQAAAAARAAVVKNVTYQLSLDVGAGGDDFTGKVGIAFDLGGSAAPVFLDFSPSGKIVALTVNGIAAPVIFHGGRLSLTDVALKLGHNDVEISFRQKYTNDGTGLVRFLDPQDHRTYLYTQFESYYANEMFPCFDQPDMKARLKLQVVAPNDWHVISTMRELSRAPESLGAEAKRLWIFPETPPLSTYLYSLHAGPFHMWKSVWRPSSPAMGPAVPLRLFARQSMVKYVNPEDWFTPTRQGFEFFTKYFDYPYAFFKYDQVICPNFVAYAMENVAAVTFGENYLYRGGMTVEQKEDLANTVIHELAHHWFGDLVTMNWWNGLWLNESFASYMATLVLAERTQFKEAWISFRDGMKEPGYVADRQATAHPVDREVPDTREAVTGFDDITYGKGASVLKQLIFRIGPDRFRDGIRLYFKTFAYRNTKLEDFFSTLEKVSRLDLKPWSQAWLRSVGTDSVRADYDCAGGKISRFELGLTPAAGSSDPRPHRTMVGLFGFSSGADPAIVLTKSVVVDYDRAVTAVPDLVGQPCPVMAFPNIEDHDYIEVHLDPRSLHAVTGHLQNVKDPLLRHILYSILFRMVQDGELSPQNYLKIVVRNFPSEQNLKIGIVILKSLLGENADGFGSAFYYLPHTLAQNASFADSQIRIEDMLWKKWQSSTDIDWRKTILESYIHFVRSEEGQRHLLEVYARLGQDRRWEALVKLTSLGNPAAARLLQAEKKRDLSEEGMTMAMAAEAAAPDLAVKKAWFQKLIQDDALPLELKQTVLDNILPAWQDSLRDQMSGEFYSQMPRLVVSMDQEFLGKFAQSFQPGICTETSLAPFKRFFGQNRKILPPAVLRVIRNGIRDGDRCVRLRAKAELAALR